MGEGAALRNPWCGAAKKWFKQVLEPFLTATARQLGVKKMEVVLVAAHAWDVAGAMAAGREAAFVARPDKVLNPGGAARRRDLRRTR